MGQLKLAALRGVRGTFGSVMTLEMRNDFKDWIVHARVRRLAGWGALFPVTVFYCVCGIPVRWSRYLPHAEV